ncbi:site-specific DNA-methyltransferase [Larkinella bovis]|uniref:site-specific DNA-methyltransferase (adenine-specific) n=1 Tax=Larkinella bovis TaxID=683041 RepID=A0ABW0IDZ2_9BACT
MPSLHWIGKEKVVNHHHDVPFRVLDHQYTFTADKTEENSETINTQGQNLIIHGDNLEALKALLPQYEGRVKCIYIDPPYNTGNEGWVYNDNVNDPKIKRWLGQVVGKESEDLSRHDKWLCMMYPRLKLLQKLMSSDGSIWISIDDSEVASLRLLMDEIFGRNKFIACNVWQKRYSRENREAIGDAHEYILVYAKNPLAFKESRNKVALTEDQAKIYKNPTNDPKGRYRTIPMTAQGYRANQMYPITTPTGVVHNPPEGRCWSTVEENYKQLLAEGRIYFGKDGNAQPSIIRYLSEVEGLVPWTWWNHEEVGHTDEAKKDIQSIYGTQTAFDTPKPVRLLERIIHIASNNGDIVLDSFAGSGTTAQAVLNLNKGISGNRQFILVEMEEYAETITAERVRRVMQGYGDKEGTGGSFNFYTLGERLFDDDGNLNPAVSTDKIRQYIWFTETKGTVADEPSDEPYRLGVYEGTAYYFCYEPESVTTLDYDLLSTIRTKAEQYIIYADSCVLSDDESIT